MYNCVSNLIIVEGDNAEEIIKSIATDTPESEHNYDLLPRVDFNKIIPMPEELEVNVLPIVLDCVKLYLTSINPNVEYFGDTEMSNADFNNIRSKVFSVEKFFSSDDALTLEEIAEISKSFSYCVINSRCVNMDSAVAHGKQAVDNIINYGAIHSYNWRNQFWGCPDNARNCGFHLTSAYFDTGDSSVPKLIQALSEQHPDNTFIYDYAAEEAGYYAGRYIFKNGQATEETSYEDGSKDAFDAFFELWGREDNYEFDEKLGTYKPIKDDMEM